MSDEIITLPGRQITDQPKGAFKGNEDEVINYALVELKKSTVDKSFTGYAENYLHKLDSNLATSTAELIKKAIANTPGMDAEQRHQLHVNFLTNAFKSLKQEKQAQQSR